MSDKTLSGSRLGLAALIVIGTGAMTSATLSPVLLGLFIDQMGFTASQASLALAAENGGYAVGLLLFYLGLHASPRVRLAAIGLTVMIATSIATPLVAAFAPFLGVRAVFGVGMGLAASTVFAAYAGRPDPQRIWSIATVANLSYAVLLLVASGWISHTFGLSGIVGVLAAVSAIGLICLLRAPLSATHAIKQEAGAPVRVSIAICGALALFCLYAGHTTLWAFQERMGLAVGLDSNQVGLLLGLSVLGALVGAGLATVLGRKIGQAWPNALAYAGLIVSAGLLATPVFGAYLAGAILIKTAWFFGLPFLLGAIARLDRSGRWSSIGAAMLAVGSAVGPAIGAGIATHGAHAIGWLAAVLYAVSFLLTLPLFIRSRQDVVQPVKA